MINNEEFIQDFVEEASQHLDVIEAGLLKAVKEEDKGNINDIFRSMHSIKGTAGFFGLDKIVDLAHVMENLLGDVRNDRLHLDEERIDYLLKCKDVLGEMIEDVFHSNDYDVTDYVKTLSMLTENGDHKEEKDVTAKVRGTEEEKILKIDKENRKVLEEALRHGHRFYKVSIALNTHLSEEERSPVKFFQKVASIGNVLDSYTDISEIGSLQESEDGEIYFTFLFTSVLEKELLPLALNIPEECIEEIVPDEETRLVNEKVLAKEKELPQEIASETMESLPLKDTNPKEDSEKNEKAKSNGKAQEKAQEKSEEKPKDTELDQDTLKPSKAKEESIRVNVNLLNDLLNLASEMVLGRNQLLRTIDPHKEGIPGIEPILQNIDRVTSGMQEKIMETRMQPIGNVFNKMPRVARDLSRSLHKEVDLKIVGEEVELDKSIIEALSDPLTHLIRNAVDHGLETEEERIAKGKNKVGKVILKAYHEGGYVNIDVSDDGKGIRVDEIAEKGIEKGLITKEERKMMGDKDLLMLLFQPGFSTSKEVTNVSGRGVGMDVVKTNIEKLGGTIEIETHVGKGTTFSLILPLTLAIVPSIIVEAGDYKFALPQVNIQEIVRLQPGDREKTLEEVEGAQVLRLRGKLLPIIRLDRVLGMKESTESIETAKEGKMKILVLRMGAKIYGLGVDEIHDEEEILVKSLPKHFKGALCYSGVTIMGDGKTAMILDPEGIVKKAKLRFTEEKSESKNELENEKDRSLKEMQNLLLFKASGPETFGIDLSLVARVEEILLKDIETVGEKSYIQYRDKSLRILRLEDVLPVAKNKLKNEKAYLIIPKLVPHPVGILIEKVHDSLMTEIQLSEENLKTKGIIGATILQGRITQLINIYEVLELSLPEYYEDIEAVKEENQKKKILVAEDTEFFAKMKETYLTSAGYEVILTKDGQEAWEKLQQEGIEVDGIISDIEMPRMDGFDLVKKIRSYEKTKNLPVIAVTSMTSEESIQKGMESGFDYYEFKLDKVRLLNTLREAILEKDRERGD